ncbi:MAG TPA: hypothetical protein VD704_13130 [Gaiellaceae bacterium]|nr:hypothetical protein [Gaiellaceae bacterium]
MTFAILVVAALVLVPGAGASLALAPPGRLSIETRIAAAFGLGFGVVAGLATLLALAHVLSRPAFIAGVVVATAAVWWLALRRASLREHASAFAEQARQDPFALGVGLVLLLVVALTRPFYAAGGTLGIRSAWRYWSDGLEIAAAGHIPETSTHWGIEIPTTVSKAALNTFEAGVSYLLGPGPQEPVYAILTVTAVGVVAALLALGRDLGLGIFAPLVPVLILLVPAGLPFAQEPSNDLRYYTAEGVGRMVAFSALVIGMYAVRAERRRALSVVTGALIAVAGLTHLVPTLVAGALLALYAVATLVLDRSALRRVLVTGGSIAAVFAVCYVGTLVLSGGDLGLQRTTSGASFQGFPPGVDPTTSFTRGRLTKTQAEGESFYIAPRTLLLKYGQEVVNRPQSPGWGRVGLIAFALLAAATAAMLLHSRRFFVVAALAWGLAAITLVVALVFSYRYDTQIPANFALRRLYDYIGFTPALILPALLATITSAWSRRSRKALAGIAVAVGVIAVAAAVERVPRAYAKSAPKAVSVFESVSDTVPCGARMLANARTAGSWQAWTGRRALTEGMSPFLRPRIMEQILPILGGANDFFSDPAANRDFLEEQDVEYLVVVAPDVPVGWGGTGFGPREGDAERVAALPEVEVLHEDELVSIFRVGAPGTDGSVDPPERCPP